MAHYDAAHYTVRLSPAQEAKVRAVVAALRAAFPACSFGASDAVRTMIDSADVDDLLRPGLGAGAGALREGR